MFSAVICLHLKKLSAVLLVKYFVLRLHFLGFLLWFLQLLQCLGDSTITLQLSYILHDLCSSHEAQEIWLVSLRDSSQSAMKLTQGPRCSFRDSFPSCYSQHHTPLLKPECRQAIYQVWQFFNLHVSIPIPPTSHSS